MINEYTRMLGLDGHIDKEKTLLQEDKTQIEKKISKLESREKEYSQMFANLKKELEGLKERKLLVH